MAQEQANISRGCEQWIRNEERLREEAANIMCGFDQLAEDAQRLPELQLSALARKPELERHRAHLRAYLEKDMQWPRARAASAAAHPGGR